MTVGGDRNFDDIADKLATKIYGSVKGKLRLAVLERDLSEVISIGTDRTPLRVLDAGGGTGQFSASLAAMGHQLVYCDHSAVMVARAREQYAERAQDADVRFYHASIQEMTSRDLAPFDLILCHAVLEWLAEPRETLQGLLQLLKPGGRVSTLFYNRNSLLMLYLIRGRFDKVMSDKLGGWGNSLTPTNPQEPEEVLSWFLHWGHEVLGYSGVRCFYDYITAKRRDEFSYEDILAAELKMSRKEAFRSTARYIHLLTRKPL